jgi:hypothetical protein
VSAPTRRLDERKTVAADRFITLRTATPITRAVDWLAIFSMIDPNRLVRAVADAYEGLPVPDDLREHGLVQRALFYRAGITTRHWCFTCEGYVEHPKTIYSSDAVQAIVNALS